MMSVLVFAAFRDFLRCLVHRRKYFHEDEEERIYFETFWHFVLFIDYICN